MEYFEYEFQGTNYVFKPTRAAQIAIDKVRKERTKDSKVRNRLTELEKKVNKAQFNAEQSANKVKEAKEKMDSVVDDAEQFKIAKAEFEKCAEKENDCINTLIDLTNEAEEIGNFLDFGGFQNEYEQVMFLLLKEQKDLFTGERTYPEIDFEFFSKICDSMYEEFGSQEYAEICQAVTDDVFMLADKENNQPKSAYLRNRKK